eukprot:9815-Heterococcus_DN1.PRE.2
MQGLLYLMPQHRHRAISFKVYIDRVITGSPFKDILTRFIVASGTAWPVVAAQRSRSTQRSVMRSGGVTTSSSAPTGASVRGCWERALSLCGRAIRRCRSLHGQAEDQRCGSRLSLPDAVRQANFVHASVRQEARFRPERCCQCAAFVVCASETSHIMIEAGAHQATALRACERTSAR